MKSHFFFFFYFKLQLLSRCTLLQINTLLELTNKYDNKQRTNNPRSSILGQCVFSPQTPAPIFLHACLLNSTLKKYQSYL